MTGKAGKTGPGPMIMVALEQGFPPNVRIHIDPLAIRFLSKGLRLSLWLKLKLLGLEQIFRWSEDHMPGMWGGFLCRKCYIDEKLLESMERSFEAIVNLGAGFDTRSFRLSEISQIPVWEVDQPKTIRKKTRLIKKELLQIPSNIRLAPIDFDHQDLSETMAKYGYGPGTKTFFIWEAVTQYLSESGINGVFDFLSSSAPGSLLAFTYVRKAFLEGKDRYGHDYIYKRMVEPPVCWHFGLDPDEVPGFLEARGWKVKEHLGYDELADRYVQPTKRDLLSTPLERMVLAEKVSD